MQRREEKNERARKEKMNKILAVPVFLKHPLLQIEKEWEYSDTLTDINRFNPSFRYDFAFYYDQPALRPWENREDTIQIVIEKWEDIQKLLEPIYKERNTQSVVSYIINGLQLYVMLLFWGNGKPVTLENLTQEFKQLTHKPINIEERFAFIVERPALYHSYIQLGELFEETRKHIVKAITIEKTKRKG